MQAKYNRKFQFIYIYIYIWRSFFAVNEQWVQIQMRPNLSVPCSTIADGIYDWI